MSHPRVLCGPGSVWSMMTLMMIMTVILVDTRSGVKWAICQKWNIYLHWLPLRPYRPSGSPCIPCVWVLDRGLPGRFISLAMYSNRPLSWLACMSCCTWAIVWLGMSIFIDFHPQWHAPSTPPPRIHLSHHHNIHITTSTGGRRRFPGLWLFIQVDGYSGKVIMLFRHLQRGG